MPNTRYKKLQRHCILQSFSSAQPSLQFDSRIVGISPGYMANTHYFAFGRQAQLEKFAIPILDS